MRDAFEEKACYAEELILYFCAFRSWQYYGLYHIYWPHVAVYRLSCRPFADEGYREWQRQCIEMMLRFEVDWAYALRADI